MRSEQVFMSSIGYFNQMCIIKNATWALLKLFFKAKRKKKLCYCRGTARRAIVVNVCYVSRGTVEELERFQTAKVTVKVIQRH